MISGLFPFFFQIASELCSSFRALRKPRREGDEASYHQPVTTIKRRIEITFFEQERIICQSVTAHCPVCRINSEMLTPEQAGGLARVQVQSIYEWLEQGKAHGMKTQDGKARISKNSLAPGTAMP